MTPEQHAELNQWIAENVMDAKSFVGLKKRGYWYRPNACGYTDRQSEAWHITRDVAKKHEYLRGDEPVVICEFDTPLYTTSPADAMAVLEKCAEKLGDDCKDMQIGKCESAAILGGKWYVLCVFRENRTHKGGMRVVAKTLPLAICLFSKALFEKEAAK